MEPLVKIDDLQVEFETYAGIVKAVRGVSLYIERGEVLALVGESGCGKSVTARCILKLIPTPPGRITRGSVYMEGRDLLAAGEKELRQVRGGKVGFIFQDPMTALNPTMKVGRQVAEVLKKHGMKDKRKLAERVRELFELVGIPQPGERVNQYPHQYSGGMRQRAMVAMALACRPGLLIADEPTTAVDVTIQAQIMELLRELQGKTGMSVLLITHDLVRVAGFAQRVAVMYAGKIVETGPAREVLDKPGHPYTMGLLASLPGPEACPEKRLITIPGRPPNLVNPGEGCLFWPRCPMAMNICARLEPGETVLAGGRTVSCWLMHDMVAGRAEGAVPV